MKADMDRLLELIKRHGAGKSTIVFCMTRNIAMKTAERLAQKWSDMGQQDRPWPWPTKRISGTSDVTLEGVMACGVSYHHAGLSAKDRQLVENAFRGGVLSVVCCTSTLAVGVNLPCTLVIIKNTLCWAGDGPKEYSEMEITQMIGRAGRPQFDDRAAAVILTRQEKVTKYKKLVSGQEIVESSLHHQLLEHLNSEITLGLVQDRATMHRWIESTFLAVRLRKNPKQYIFDGAIFDEAEANGKDASEWVEKKSTGLIRVLRENNLLEGDATFSTTEFGIIMARYHLRFKTMKRILSLPKNPDIADILFALAGAEELREIKWRNSEKKILEQLNAAPEIRYPIKVNVATVVHKVSILVQATMGDVGIPNAPEFQQYRKQYDLDENLIFNALERLIRSVVDCQIHLHSGKGTRHALELSRSLAARAWDDSPSQMRQIYGVGPAAVKKLIGAKVMSLEDLEAAGPHQVNVIMGRNPPCGENMMKHLDAIPKLSLCLREMDFKSNPGQPFVLKFTATIAFLNNKFPETFNRKMVYVCFVAERSDGYLVDFRRMPAKYTAQNPLNVSAKLERLDQRILCYVMCDDVAGSLRSAEIQAKHASQRPDVSESVPQCISSAQSAVGGTSRSSSVESLSTALSLPSAQSQTISLTKSCAKFRPLVQNRSITSAKQPGNEDQTVNSSSEADLYPPSLLTQEDQEHTITQEETKNSLEEAATGLSSLPKKKRHHLPLIPSATNNGPASSKRQRLCDPGLVRSTTQKAVGFGVAGMERPGLPLQIRAIGANSVLATSSGEACFMETALPITHHSNHENRLSDANYQHTSGKLKISSRGPITKLLKSPASHTGGVRGYFPTHDTLQAPMAGGLLQPTVTTNKSDKDRRKPVRLNGENPGIMKVESKAAKRTRDLRTDASAIDPELYRELEDVIELID